MTLYQCFKALIILVCVSVFFGTMYAMAYAMEYCNGWYCVPNTIVMIVAMMASWIGVMYVAIEMK